MLTEQDLRDRGVGKIIQPRDYGWDTKARTYREEDVWKTFSALRSAYRVVCTDDTGWVDNPPANKMSQKQIDTYLLRRAKGEPVSLPLPYGHVPKVKGSSDKDTGLLDKAEFGENLNKPMKLIDDWGWVYNNLAIEDIQPSDAPNPGAYKYLKWVQEKSENMVDFYKTVLPKIAPTRSQIENMNKRNDDGRSNTDLLSRLSAEIARSQE